MDLLVDHLHEEADDLDDVEVVLDDSDSTSFMTAAVAAHDAKVLAQRLS